MELIKKLFDFKHKFWFMSLMILLSGMAIQVCMPKGDWLGHGDASFVSICLGLVIAGVISFTAGWGVEKYQRKTGKGVYEKKDLKNNAIGIGRGAIVVIVILVIIKLISVF